MLRTVLALSLLLPLSSALAAEKTCASRADILDHLAYKYAEAPVAVGLANNGGVIEVLSSGHGETWTIIITMPDGESCMVAAGEGWDQLSPATKTGSRI